MFAIWRTNAVFCMEKGFNMSTRKKRSFTLTEEADALLDKLSEKYGISKTAVLEILIRERAKAEDVSTKLSP